MEDLISTPMEKEAGLTTIQKLSSEFWISGANVIKMSFCHGCLEILTKSFFHGKSFQPSLIIFGKDITAR
jgi:hypothetical protein